MEEASLISMAITFFIIIDPIGSIPPIVALTKDFSFQRQRFIIFREILIALILGFFFQYLGEYFLNLLKVQPFALKIMGGSLLFLVALEMLFALPVTAGGTTATKQKQEPFIFPIATPLLSGPGLLTVIMIMSGTEPNPLKLSAALTLAWIASCIVLAFAPYLQKLLGKVGLSVLEQMMGLLLAFVSVEMFVQGTYLLKSTLGK